MIKLVKVNKYFNRFKKNENHVINNTSFELGNSGLVSLLGESGSGKTTLLNAIGGLDNINSGSIYIDGKKLSRFSYFKDKIRTLKIGYIFQNYNLIDNMSVFDNIALSLRMIGIKDKEEIKKRVNYVLEKIDMYRYRKRPASALSGGQRQRVGIARAIVKNPDVIIADEPTGNLDSKNTIEVMNIIKTISQEKLVILVTHEKPLAMFYSDKIIELVDGKVEAIYDNNHNDELDYRIDNKIYLKDIKKCEKVSGDMFNGKIYNESLDNINFTIVVKNGNIYIESDKKVEVVDSNSNIEIVNEHYKKITKDDYIKNKFDLSILSNDKKLKYSSIYNPISMIAKGISIVLDYKFIKKMLLGGFVISAMFILFSISNIAGVMHIDDSDFLKVNKKYYSLNIPKGNIEKINNVKNLLGDGSIIPSISGNYQIEANTIYQFQDRGVDVSAPVAFTDVIDKSDLIYGMMPGDNEVLVDKRVIENNIDKFNSPKSIGILSYKDLVGKYLVNGKLKLRVSGIVDCGVKSFYINKKDFSYLINSEEYANFTSNYRNIKDGNFTLKEGRLPGDYEALVHISEKENYKLNSYLNSKINNNKLKVVGYYTSPYTNDSIYISDNTVSNLLYSNWSKFYVYGKEDSINNLINNGYEVQSTYEQDRLKFISNRQKSVNNNLLIAGVFLLISFVEIFLMIRSSFMSRIKEVGILRAIGIKKIDIYKMFMGEILVITTVASVPGLIIMNSFLKQISSVSLISKQFIINKEIFIISVIVVYVLNLVVGLLPLFNVMRNTPHKILSRNDVD
jgi:ABC-type transport system, ATP-binding and permease components